MAKIKSKDNIYIILKFVIYILTGITLIFFAKFWMGSQDNWEEIVKNEFYPALITRTIFLTIIGLFFLLISYLVAFFFKKKYHFLKELIILIVFSLITNIYILLV
ncbi:hypothetical protein EG349_01255 [Chryseobacterium shandongense]|uniref:Uncharacterized protein n=1 Tax=Chryseobacterium shandongense TaxID=1493872 RepID=A0AAD0YBW0_9FLAO|nr:hypothetical protein EG349_01255 [Chryseobacterium shandongense]AZA97684.1 hypothetical protein EG353_20070 [Chryseobacterium shandongense]